VKNIRLISAVLLVLAAGAVISASDPFAVYARVDRVVFEPTDSAPDAVQVWGVFAIAVADNPNDYQPPAKGYMYFKAPPNKETARKEWADLKAVAGTGEIVSFGSRWNLHARVRKADEKPASPDTYTLNIGLQRARSNTQYAPIRSILDFKQ